MAWAAYFVDYPPFGVAVRRLNSLMDSVSRLERTQFSPILDSLVLGCYGDREDLTYAYSTLSSEWTLLPLHPKTKAWMQASWARCTSNEEENVSDVSANLANPEDNRKLPARRRSPGTPPAKRSAPPVTGPIPSRKQANVAPTRPATAPSTSTSPAGFNLADLGSLVTQILATQADSSLRLHQSFQANMLENIRATLTALGATGGTKESKLSDAKIQILQACSGHGDTPLFALSKFYAKIDREGITTKTCGWVL
jgi:hypothetical protein